MKKVKKMTRLLLMMSFLPIWLYAQETPAPPPFPHEVAWKYAGDRIAVPANGEVKIDMSGFPARDGFTPVLRFAGYFPGGGGYNNTMQIEWNGKPLTNQMKDGSSRVLRRPFISSADGMTEHWHDARGWLISFSGADHVHDKRIADPNNEGFFFTLNIADILDLQIIGADDRVEKDARNAIVFKNTLHLAEYSLCIEELAVYYVPDSEMDALSGGGINLLWGWKDRFAGELNGGDYWIGLSENGGLAVKVGEAYFFCHDGFSYADDPTMKYNVFSVGDPAGEPSWKPAVKVSGKTATVTAFGKDYAVVRTVTVEEGYFKVVDEIKNTSGFDLGFNLKFNVFTDEKLSPDNFRLGGNLGVHQLTRAATNPGIFLQSGDASIGVVADDNVFRNQIVMYFTGNGAFFDDPYFGLAAGKNYSIERLFFPKRNADYFSFVNHFRRLRNVNQVMHGQFGLYVYATRTQNPVDLKIRTVGKFFEYANGGDLTRDEWLADTRKDMAEARERNPDAFLIGNLETNLIPVDLRAIPGAVEAFSTLEQKRYGAQLTKEQTALLESLPHAPDALRTSDGRMIVDTYYTHYYDWPSIHLLVQLESGNYQEKYMTEQADFMMDSLGLDGLYLDQFAPGSGQQMYRVDRYRYDRWDGFTVTLTPEGRIREKLYDYVVTGVKARGDMLRHILDKGKVVVVNCLPVDRDNMVIPTMSFNEMENDGFSASMLLGRDKPSFLPVLTSGHLGNSPLGLGIRFSRYNDGDRTINAKLLNRSIITALRNGVLLFYYDFDIPLEGPGAGGYGPGSNMFPFTPVEINEGFMIGKERILTAISRSFDVVSKREPVCLLFDEFGRDTQAPFKAVRLGAKKWRIDVKLDDWNEIAAIILEGEPAAESKAFLERERKR